MHRRTQGCRVTGTDNGQQHLSYKFQRLREQLRAAILSGLYRDRLPGERELGRRYKANPKTINKALGDLSSEGLIVRHIGRGTFVARKHRGPAVAGRPRSFRCLLLPDACHHPHRAAMIEAVRRRLVAQENAWESVTVKPMSRGHSIELSGWCAAERHATDGLLCYPAGPLSSSGGRPSDELVADTFRRHVPVVVLAACADSAKLNAVLPDFSDAGFRLVEHLAQMGCQTVVALCSREGGREVALVVNGCLAAAGRSGCQVSRAVLGPDGRLPVLPAEMQVWLDKSQAFDGESRRHRHPTIGVVCVGHHALRAVLADGGLTGPRLTGLLAVTCMSEPGDRAAEAAGITSYEVDAGLIASWAARLVLEARPADSPLEVIVPGRLCIRDRLTGGRESNTRMRVS